PLFLDEDTHWADSVLATLTLEQKIAQFFMVAAWSSDEKNNRIEIETWIKQWGIGGVIFFQGDTKREIKLTNQYQKLSKVPLMVGIDGEWGPAMRLTDCERYPYQLTMGATQNADLIKDAGYWIGKECQAIGIHINFAPDVDVNSNPKNPVINYRSFGEDPTNVANLSGAFVEGMENSGVLSCAKHFPGHGDTDSDSHKTLPSINFDKKRIDSVEFYPYRKLIQEGLSSVMVAHLNVPALESRDGFPSSLSYTIVTEILKERLQFQGLIYTDALNMKGVANYSSPGDVDLAAFMAGNDVLLISENVPRAINKIVEAYNSGLITEERLAHSVKKILQSKYKVGLNNYKPVDVKHLVSDLNRIKDQALSEILFENAITVIKNKKELLPLRELEKKKIAYVKMGDDDGSAFFKELQKYAKVHEVSAESLEELIRKLSSYNTVIVGLHRSNDSPWKDFKFTNKELVWLHEIARNNNVILDVFVKPYALLDLTTAENFESIVVSYQNSEVAQKKSAQLIFGAISAKGMLPVSVGNGFQAGDGIAYSSLSRLNYGLPERVGMSSEKLKKLDSIAQYAVDKKMTPGIQLLVARKGKVVYNKNFGTHTYAKKSEPVEFDDIYDVASLTKIIATLPLLMELEDKGVVNLDSKLSDLLPEYAGSNKKNITLKKMLSHYARLKPWVPFYFATLNADKQPDPKYYRKEYSKQFSVKVANDLYMRTDYQDSIQKTIKDSDLLDRESYRYSDLPYYILKKYIETYYDKGLDELVQEHFYESLGANYTTYNPYVKFSGKKIVPTEIDDYYRYQEVHGYVHDMGAAMQNGVGGHAGIFSNANDVAKIMQLFLQKGFYGGKRYFKPETVDEYNTCYFCDQNIRRGIGFDKPQLGDSGPTCGCVSMTSFGHSGFTGTYAWADPEEEIVYVFLANRTYPKADSNLLLKANIRTAIQRLIYEAIID
ncbi:MAG: glycoside hydrolase family 3 N-terminal domain-containing protein, partial [Xanthomarina sp.]